MNKYWSNYIKNFLPQIGFHEVHNCTHIKNGFGITNLIDTNIGTGFHWIYPVDDKCFITYFDVRYHNDMSYKFDNSHEIVLAHCTNETAKPILTHKNKSKTLLIGYQLKEETQKYVIPKNTCIKNISITLSPKYYKLHKELYGDVDSSLILKTFLSLNGMITFPEIDSILNQIASYVPRTNAAKLYYKAKILELTSLLLEWNKYTNQKNQCITKCDKNYLNEMIHNIEMNLNRTFTISELAKNCCMSKAKLTYLFRQIYGMSIIDYIQNLRIQKTKELLLNSDLSIGEISNVVGYKCPSSLSEIFKKKIGQTPNKYRKYNRYYGDIAK